jgi:simple sugar transport system permease protein
MRRLLESLAALAAALTVSGIVVLSSGGNPLVAFGALVEGAFGSLDSLSELGVNTCPLLLTGLAMTVAFRAGVWNIGAEGQLAMGAMAMAALGSRFGGLPGPVALAVCMLGASLAGAAWAAIAAVLKVRRNVNEIISTIMLNFIALSLISYLVQGPLMEAGGRYPQTDAIDVALWMPRLAPYRIHAGLLLGLLLASAVGFLLFRTVAGFEMRAAGLNATASRLAGIDVDRRIMMALILSGALAGIAGAVEVSAVARRMYEHFSPGWGFTSIAVALLGRLHPAGVVVAAFFFGALDAGSNAMQRAAGVSSVLVSLIQGTIVVFLVLLDRRRDDGIDTV